MRCHCNQLFALQSLLPHQCHICCDAIVGLTQTAEVVALQKGSSRKLYASFEQPTSAMSSACV